MGGKLRDMHVNDRSVRAVPNSMNPYYSGLPSDHFDGLRFFNPDGVDTDRSIRGAVSIALCAPVVYQRRAPAAHITYAAAAAFPAPRSSAEPAGYRRAPVHCRKRRESPDHRVARLRNGSRPVSELLSYGVVRTSRLATLPTQGRKRRNKSRSTSRST
jgi:hypothetical protein